jgi:hypothetical protein
LFHGVQEGQASELLDVLPEMRRRVTDSDSLIEVLVFDLPTLQTSTASNLILQDSPDGLPQLLLQQY